MAREPLRRRLLPAAAWSLLALAWVSAPVRGEIVITEIHYAPVDETGAPRPELEFVEIFNDSPQPYDLYKYRFTRGFQFEFTTRLILKGRSYHVVCRDVEAVKGHYGITNAVGNFVGALDNSGETIVLANPQGIPVSTVSYNDRNRWPAAAKGTGHSLSIRNPYSDPEDPDSWTISARMGGTPGAPNGAADSGFAEAILIEVGQLWRYFKGTQEPSSPTTAWRQAGFDDASWLSGPTGIGYGDGDDATVLSDMQGNYRTIFCRKAFSLDDVAAIDQLVLTITYDDGFYAYLNGVEVASRNVAGRAFDQDAPSSIEPTTEEIDISAFKGSLVVGTNVLAVQVHNAGIGSSDLSFIPRLASRSAVVEVLINEGYFRNAPGESRFVELHNPGPAPVDVSGYHLTDDFANLKKLTIPAQATIPAKGHLAFTEAELGLDLSWRPVARERISIALTAPSGARVVDAAIFAPQVEGKSEARFPDGDRRFAPAADPTPGAPNRVTVRDEVILNEIMYNPLSLLGEDEYIEIYNRGTETVDLTGWSLSGVAFDFPPGTTIDPGAYLVIARDPARIRTSYGLGASTIVSTPWGGRLRSGGERVSLIDDIGNVVDSVRYHDGGEWAPWADGGGSSLERIDPHGESDAATSWDASDDSAKAETVTISYTNVPYGGGESDLGMMLAQEGIAIIDDISLVRVGSSTNLVSNGTFETSTTPWRLQGTHIRSGRTTDPLEVIAGAGSLKLICHGGSGDYKVNRIETDTGTQTTGNYTVSFKARWVVGSPRVITIGDYNVSQPQNPGLAGSNLIPVPEILGTPGAINSVTVRQIARTGSSNIGPAIDRVYHAPPVPEANEVVTVHARVRDPDGVSSVALRYRTETPVGTFSTRTMSDPDGDGIYTGTIPGQALGTRVLFYIQASDALDATTRFPADIMARTHPPVLRPAAAAPNDSRYCMYRHDRRVISTPHHGYRFILNSQSESYLGSRLQLSNEMVEGTFVFGSDKVYYSSGIRFAGSPWLRNRVWSNSYSLEMPRDDPLHGRKRDFNLDQHGSDGRERLSHYLLRQSAGPTRLPYFDFQALVRFQVNDVRDATYEALDKPNKQYFKFWFPEDEIHTIFEMDDRFSFNDAGNKTGNADGKVLFPPYGATTGGTNRENYRWFFAPRDRRDLDDFDSLIELCRIMDPRVTSNTVYDQTIFDVADVEEMLRVWAIRMHTDDWDTWGTSRGKNCYLYQSSSTGLWHLVPWDCELTYDTNQISRFGLPYSSGLFPEVQRMLNRPRIKRMYYGILAEQVDLAQGFFHSGFLAPYMQELAAAGVSNTQAGMPNGFVDRRAVLIRSWVNSSIFPQVRLRITTNQGNAFASPTPVVSLSGDAPADIFYLAVLRNGVFLDDPAPVVQFSNATMTGWTVLDIPLVPEANAITILGLGSGGDIVDEASIDVESTANWLPPSIAAVEPASGAPGDRVTIVGSDLQQGLQVIFGVSTPSPGVQYDEATDPTRATAIVPAGIAAGDTEVRVRNIDAQESEPFPFTMLPALEPFIRGDANSSGLVDLSDALKILLYLFGGVPITCEDAADADDSGLIDVTDALYVLGFLFQNGPAPPAPYPASGTDPTRGDSLDCVRGLP